MDKNFKRIVHVTTYANGGAGHAAIRLHNALLKEGIDSYFICLDKNLPEGLINGYSISAPEKTFWQWQSLRIKYRAKKHLGLNLYNYKETISHKLSTISSELECEIASLPFAIYLFWEHPVIQKADIIHLHWVSGMLDYPSFFSKNLKPVVWTLHDMNAFHGFFHYKEDESKNKKIIGKLDQEIISIKAKAIQNRKSRLAVVTPSRWLLKDALSSEVFKDVNGFCIPNPIDTNIFKPQKDVNFKRRNNVPEKNVVFLFVAQLVNIRPKGFALLVEALQQVNHLPITLFVLGDSNELNIGGLDLRRLGAINDENILSSYYSNADAFITPSRDENLPYVMVESLCCGTPVIGFPIGGIKENIINYENGLLAEKVDSRALAEAIENFYKNRDIFNSEKINSDAQSKFNEHLIVQKYLEVYKNIIGNSL